jgi:integrase
MAKADKSQITESAIDRVIRIYTDDGIRTSLIDPECAGLNIRPTKNGKAEWSLKMRDQAGQQKRFPLGQYPTMKIKKAREAAEATRYRVRHAGEDPHAERQAKREAAKNPPALGLTLQGMIDAYAAEVGDIRKSWWMPKPTDPSQPAPPKLANQAKLGDGKRRIESVFSDYLKTPAKDLKRADLLKTIGAWPSRSSAAAAVRYSKPMFAWAVDREYVPAELTLLKEPKGVVKKRSRYLAPPELTVLLQALKDFKSRGKPSIHAAAMRFILLTATRLDEVCSATWGEISESTWEIPGHRIKNPKPETMRPSFVVPLPRQAVELLMAMKPAASDPEQLIFGNRQGNHLDQWDRVTKQIQEKCGFGDWHRHDLRRTASTSMGNLGVLPAIVDAALNHADIHSSLAGTYNQSRYTPEVGIALQKLADWYDHLQNNSKSGDARTNEQNAA